MSDKLESEFESTFENLLDGRIVQRLLVKVTSLTNHTASSRLDNSRSVIVVTLCYIINFGI